MSSNRIKHNVRKIFWEMGYDISRFDAFHHSIARKKKLFGTYNIDCVLDVGANTGQFAEEIRKDIGFSGKIISFEPVHDACEIIKKKIKSDKQWQLMSYALGDKECKKDINISGNFESNSLLKMEPKHIESAPESKYISSESIQIKTLDSIFQDICPKERNIYLKIDTQGYEKNVLIGAMKSLQKIDTIQLEMSLVPLYEGGILFDELFLFLKNLGYKIVAVEPAFVDMKTGELLQIDAVFHR